MQKTDLLKPPRAGRKTLKCLITHSGVGTGKSVTFERLRPDCYVGAYIYSLDVSESAASGIVEKRSRALGCVAAGGVEQKGGSADSRIFVSGVQYQRSSANTGIEAAIGNALERKPTNCCVGSASRQTERAFCPSAVVKLG